ncbi:MAG TPA: SDR family oxidoreductase [Holophagaceae bacterium]|nr:SDR family oxidoreductase [Holophagaceae bacterium]
MTVLKNAVVLVTGAASGIGRLMALEAASRGARLALVDRDETGLERVRSELEGRGQLAMTFPCDLRDRVAIQATFAEVEAALGGVDVLINNAGVVGGKPLLEASPESIELTFQVNALAPIWTSRAALPGMIARGRGHIVTLASAGGLVGTTRLVDYCASKFAAVGFDDALRAELRRLGLPIQTTVVCPFFIDTGMFAGVKTRLPWLLPILRPEDVAARVIRAVELDRARLLMPWAVHLVTPLRILPVSWFDALMRWLGVSMSMDDFTGRAGSR